MFLDKNHPASGDRKRDDSADCRGLLFEGGPLPGCVLLFHLAAAGKRQPLQPEKVAEAVKTAFTEPRVSTSAKMNPDPSVRGLRYGKPPKNTDAYRYVDRVPRRRADRFIWIAVIAALLAVAAIAFGLWRDAREKQAENEYIELPQAAELPSAASQPEQLE